MNYIPGAKIKPPSRQREINAQLQGFKAGMLAMAVTMHDLFDETIDLDMIEATCKGAIKVMYAIADGTEDCKYMSRRLAEEIGIDILEVGEKGSRL